MIKQNVRFFSTGLFITQLWYAFDLSQYRKSNSSTKNTYTHLSIQIKKHQTDLHNPSQRNQRLNRLVPPPVLPPLRSPPAILPRSLRPRLCPDPNRLL